MSQDGVFSGSVMLKGTLPQDMLRVEARAKDMR